MRLWQWAALPRLPWKANLRRLASAQVSDPKVYAAFVVSSQNSHVDARPRLLLAAQRPRRESDLGTTWLLDGMDRRRLSTARAGARIHCSLTLPVSMFSWRSSTLVRSSFRASTASCAARLSSIASAARRVTASRNSLGSKLLLATNTGPPDRPWSARSVTPTTLVVDEPPIGLASQATAMKSPTGGAMARSTNPFAPRRRKSLNEVLGITQMERNAKKQLGMSKVQQAMSPSARKRKLKTRMGYYSGPARFFRWAVSKLDRSRGS